MMSDVPRWCQLCDGTGLVTIYHPLDVKAVREGCDSFRSPNGCRVRAGVREDGSPRHALASVPCKCSKGDRHALWFCSRSSTEPKRMPRFGESVNHVQPVRRPGGQYDLAADVEAACTVVEWEF